MTPQDTRVLRRALVAGGVVFGCLALVGVGVTVAAGAGGAFALVAVMAAFTGGALVSAGWLLLALLLDLLAGELPSLRRVAWSALIFAIAFVSPALVLGALEAAV